MSYCRFGADDYACDVYAYADVSGGFTIHVAAIRYAGAIPKVDWNGFEAERIDAATFAQHHEEQMAYLRECARTPIGLPADGERYREPDHAAFKARLLDLRALGYRFPDDVITTIDAELTNA